MRYFDSLWGDCSHVSWYDHHQWLQTWPTPRLGLSVALEPLDLRESSLFFKKVAHPCFRGCFHRIYRKHLSHLDSSTKPRTEMQNWKMPLRILVSKIYNVYNPIQTYFIKVSRFFQPAVSWNICLALPLLAILSASRSVDVRGDALMSTGGDIWNMKYCVLVGSLFPVQLLIM